MTWKPCIVCGEPAAYERCYEHRLPSRQTSSAHSRGYDAAWVKLSKRARRLQPWCSDCHTTEDLTCDHTTEAWVRKAKGLPIRLEDVDVVCRSCNTRRGRARPTGDTPPEAEQALRGNTDFGTHTSATSRSDAPQRPSTTCWGRNA